jgi:hypothetical protein
MRPRETRIRRQSSAKIPVKKPNENPRAVKRLRQQEVDSSCHRLSRVPEKHTNRAVENEKQESFAAKIFKNQQDRDNTPPDQKLIRLQEQLDGELENPERFACLIQQKAIRYIIYGENSDEALQSHASIGIFYNQTRRPASAIRHLTKAHKLEQVHQADPDLSLQIAVNTSEAYLDVKASRPAEAGANIGQAAEAIDPYKETEIEDPRLRYRRDLILARIAGSRSKHEEAIRHYQSAWVALDEAGGVENEEGAQLHSRLADSQTALKKRKSAAENYELAYNIYRGLGMDEAADALEPKLPAGDEEDYVPPPPVDGILAGFGRADSIPNLPPVKEPEREAPKSEPRPDAAPAEDLSAGSPEPDEHPDEVQDDRRSEPKEEATEATAEMEKAGEPGKGDQVVGDDRKHRTLSDTGGFETMDDDEDTEGQGAEYDEERTFNGGDDERAGDDEDAAGGGDDEEDNGGRDDDEDNGGDDDDEDNGGDDDETGTDADAEEDEGDGGDNDDEAGRDDDEGGGEEDDGGGDDDNGGGNDDDGGDDEKSDRDDSLGFGGASTGGLDGFDF